MLHALSTETVNIETVKKELLNKKYKGTKLLAFNMDWLSWTDVES